MMLPPRRQPSHANIIKVSFVLMILALANSSDTASMDPRQYQDQNQRAGTTATTQAAATATTITPDTIFASRALVESARHFSSRSLEGNLATSTTIPVQESLDDLTPDWRATKTKEAKTGGEKNEFDHHDSLSPSVTSNTNKIETEIHPTKTHTAFQLASRDLQIQQDCATRAAYHPDYSLSWKQGKCDFTITCNSRGYDTELACCQAEYAQQVSGFCLSQLDSPPTTSPTKKGGPDIWYPDYSLEWSKGICVNTLPKPLNANPIFASQLACCKGAYAGQTSKACILGLPNPPTSSPTKTGGNGDLYYPDYTLAWSKGKCINTVPMPSGRPIYITQLDCCKGAYGGQMSNACIASLASPPTSSPSKKGGLDIWYPDYSLEWSKGICVNTVPRPLNANPIFASQLACCKGAYAGQTSKACILGLPNPPTSSPTKTGGKGDIYYPDYTLAWSKGKCINTVPVPSGRPTYTSMLGCCKEAYRGQMSNACIASLASNSTMAPTHKPTTATSTVVPTALPTHTPSNIPTDLPTNAPTFIPTLAPTAVPTHLPTSSPTHAPTHVPTFTPTLVPTALPTSIPSSNPSTTPTSNPSRIPTSSPSLNPNLVHIVKVQLQGTNYLHMREVEVFDADNSNVAFGKNASQSSTISVTAAADMAVNGILTDLAHTNSQAGAYWQVNLGSGYSVSRVKIYNRNDGSPSHAAAVSSRLSNACVRLLNNQNTVLKSYCIGNASSISIFDISFTGSNGNLIAAYP